jgi:hypothetical protein
MMGFGSLFSIGEQAFQNLAVLQQGIIDVSYRVL